MNEQETKSALLSAASYFNAQSEGYKSWGHVNVLQAALKFSPTGFLVTDEKKQLIDITVNDIRSGSATDTLPKQIFADRKKVSAILITRQQYASQLKEEVPAILDDQAQLLGVSIRIAANENGIVKALSGRYAAILPNGNSVCIGHSLEDAYVAAQLLEKTAKTFIEAKHIGGAKAINKIEAWFMQQYYLFKYSKEAVKNK
jgi:ribulose-5-phosphate 4-epimerase/fuculose-1-phosphate aldolase